MATYTKAGWADLALVGSGPSSLIGRSRIETTAIARAGVSPGNQRTADATNKHYVEYAPGNMFVEVVSTDASPQNVTFKIGDAFTTDGLTVSDLVISIPAGGTQLIGPFRPKTFSQTLNANQLWVDPAVSTTLKFRAYTLTATP
jgi:hypothetical protein